MTTLEQAQWLQRTTSLEIISEDIFETIGIYACCNSSKTHILITYSAVIWKVAQTQ